MKKIVAGLMLAVCGLSANANVLCNIVTKDPRYHVTSYVRSQTACVTTTHAGASAVGTQILRLGALWLVVKGIEYLVEQKRENALTEQSKVETVEAPKVETVVEAVVAVAEAKTIETLVSEKAPETVYKIVNLQSINEFNKSLKDTNRYGINGRYK